MHTSDNGEPPVATAPLPHEPSALPIADGVERRLDPRSVHAERLGWAIFVTIFAAVSLIGLVIFAVAARPARWALLMLPLLWLAACGAWVALGLWWPKVRYRYTFYAVSEQGLRIRRGVLFRTVSTVPRNRIQHTDVSQGPIERTLELATLIVYTAGTHHASVHLDGLAHETALAVRDHLIDGGEDDGV